MHLHLNLRPKVQLLLKELHQLIRMTMVHLSKARRCVMVLCESKCYLQLQIDEGYVLRPVPSAVGSNHRNVKEYIWHE